MSLPLVRPSLRRQDFDLVLDSMIHDRLGSGEINRTLCREIGKSLGLKEVLVLDSVFNSIQRLVLALGLRPGDLVVVSPLASPYWVGALGRLGIVPLFVDVCENSPVLRADLVKAVMDRGPKAIVADACLGYLPDVEALSALGIPVIEDISHGLWGTFSGRLAGTVGWAVLAHFAPETLVAGSGGCFVGFRTPPDASILTDSPWEYLSDLGSSLILSQWRDAQTFAERKSEYFRVLFHRLPKSYRTPRQIGDAEPVRPWFPVWVESGAKDVLAYTRKKAVESDWAFRSQPHLNVDSEADFCPSARSFLFHTVVFPLYATISSKELDLLTKVISSLP